ncbi:bifunctional diaminohydroxyphosphoribosylaminopyrimidine deaminase/5-amino-6-(5-phosphoribosylamino)uracil reductase RibD [Shimazuella kribbensis]|uniref:bifunctional diaminohydroxyphosphoribosylaminopyrimidine deaminase/5-amino-6-(5-phosphoribosylamino)uracil reductase RibD n=1 Tax=Shimazuella kribbensis TaxID=139808 RepID=UPI0003FDC46C|nr:bifunctional diaminohydroxyphosphoribosylaminopyrimidine deaminase/5-amino-6-(5-phosphoribosylamino)uracil reductase RibD [Shimazuella kribbensis]
MKFNHQEIIDYYNLTKLPFVVLKTAMTLDGKLATESGDSKWVTNSISRENVHYIRHNLDGIMVGINTVLNDNPSLTTRLPEGGGKNPIRIVADSKLRIPLDFTLVNTTEEAQTWVFCSEEADEKKARQLEERGVKVFRAGNNSVDLVKVMKILGENGVKSVLLEGGGQLNWSMLEAGLIQKVVSFIAPKLLGGKRSITPIGGKGFDLMAQAVELENISIERFGDDICITGYPIKK